MNKKVDDEDKIWIAVRTDLEMPPGKLAVQVAHAAASIVFFNYNARTIAYMLASQPKICVGVKNLAALNRVCTESKEIGLQIHLVKDAARTFFEEPTFTCVAIGPCKKSDLPKFVQRLQLL